VELLQMAAIAAGRSAEFMGAVPWEILDINSYNDRIPQSSLKLYEVLDQETKLKYDAFAAGFEAYTQQFPEEYPRDAGFNQMLPLSGLDWFRTNMRVLFSFSFSGAGSLQLSMEEKWNHVPDPRQAEREADGKAYTTYMKDDPLFWSGISDEDREVLGSNAWAINGKKSSGNPMLNINPHLPFSGFFRWYEAQMVCEACGIDIYGANLIGMPGLTIGFNDDIGWTHTVNYGRPFSGFELTLNPDNDMQYLYDGEWVDVRVEENIVKVREALSGDLRERTVVNEYSIHGLITSRTDGRAMASRLPGVDTTELRAGTVKQWWDLAKTHNLDEFNEVMRDLQIPMFYTAVATKEGDIMLNWNG
jgi:acyl-homoserine-lactone acylase